MTPSRALTRQWTALQGLVTQAQAAAEPERVRLSHIVMELAHCYNLNVGESQHLK